MRGQWDEFNGVFFFFKYIPHTHILNPCFIFLTDHWKPFLLRADIPFQSTAANYIFYVLSHISLQWGLWFSFAVFFFFPVFNLFLSLFIYFERVREYKLARGRRRERQNPTQPPRPQCRARCGAWTCEPWDHDPSRDQESDSQPTESPRSPSFFVNLEYLRGWARGHRCKRP